MKIYTKEFNLISRSCTAESSTKAGGHSFISIILPSKVFRPVAITIPIHSPSVHINPANAMFGEFLYEFVNNSGRHDLGVDVPVIHVGTNLHSSPITDITRKSAGTRFPSVTLTTSPVNTPTGSIFTHLLSILTSAYSALHSLKYCISFVFNKHGNMQHNHAGHFKGGGITFISSSSRRIRRCVISIPLGDDCRILYKLSIGIL
mmetsp:Transcript_26968/g.39942  ORF Transcript_26968/g.39942 Transcript_26968/m.39942 type:complete len:204 (-) Transcript_26968:117-728(-)